MPIQGERTRNHCPPGKLDVVSPVVRWLKKRKALQATTTGCEHSISFADLTPRGPKSQLRGGIRKTPPIKIPPLSTAEPRVSKELTGNFGKRQFSRTLQIALRSPGGTFLPESLFVCDFLGTWRQITNLWRPDQPWNRFEKPTREPFEGNRLRLLCA
jgi:hypothetical protein